MPTLILSYLGEKLHTYPLDREHLLKIGRSDQNDIILDETAVSALHAEIEFDSDGYYITDIKSKNGTFVDGELVISRKLKNGNRIAIGNYSLLFQGAGDDSGSDELDTVSQATMTLDTDIHRSRLAKSLAEIGEEKTPQKPQAVLTFLDGSRKPFSLEQPLTRIGKDTTCEIRAKGLFMSKRAAEIIRRDDVFYITPADGKTRVRVNYEAVREETVLRDFDVIEVGATKMQFHFSIT